MEIPSILEMLQAGVHFGHKGSRWYPKMKPFIFTQRNQVHIVDLEKTKVQLEIILPQIKQLAKEGKQILFVSTKPQAKAIVKKAAQDCGMPFLVDRWIGGMLTNFTEIKKLVKNYVTLKDQQDKGQLGKYTKKEQLEIGKKIEKMDKYLSGLVSLNNLPDVVFIPSMQCEKTAVTEANRMSIPIIGICDTNANPNKAEYVIPANDDAVKSIEMMVGLVRDTIKKGVAEKTKDVASIKVEDKKENVAK
ncbi:MAG: 30S ribosomal protein S2 [Candidatus Magasanikbacteria bacterium]